MKEQLRLDMFCENQFYRKLPRKELHEGLFIFVRNIVLALSIWVMFHNNKLNFWDEAVQGSIHACWLKLISCIETVQCLIENS